MSGKRYLPIYRRVLLRLRNDRISLEREGLGRAGFRRRDVRFRDQLSRLRAECEVSARTRSSRRTAAALNVL